MMRLVLPIVLGCLMLSSSPFLSAQENGSTQARPLFNGVDLTGWVRVNTPEETWSVQDGMLVCTGKPIGELRTDRMYQNFVLEVEWRHLVPGGNAGIFLWADDITARGQPFHRGIEVQVLEHAYGNTDSYTTHGDIFPIHGAKMVPRNGRGGDRAFPTESRALPSPQWNHYRITCQDGSVALEVNGKEVTRGDQCSPRKGYICLESEGGVVHYRNLKIQELPDTPVEPQMVAIADRGFQSLYSGLDLRGWKQAVGSGLWKPSDWVLRFEGQADQSESLISERMFGPGRWICDFQLPEADSQLRWQWGDDESPIFRIASDLPEVNAALVKPGSWNRMEVAASDHQIVAWINSKEVLRQPAKIDRPIPWKLLPRGKVSLANLYYSDRTGSLDANGNR
jgi:hypothetical protein